MSTVKEVISKLQEQLDKNLSHTSVEFTRIRAGKASPDMLDGVMVEYYGAATPLSQVANVNTPDARTISIQPWEKTLIRPIETAIINANLGFAPQNDGEFIRISIPPVTDAVKNLLNAPKQNVKILKLELEIYAKMPTKESRN
jgi:ribosome recycling factor